MPPLLRFMSNTSKDNKKRLGPDKKMLQISQSVIGEKSEQTGRSRRSHAALTAEKSNVQGAMDPSNRSVNEDEENDSGVKGTDVNDDLNHSTDQDIKGMGCSSSNGSQGRRMPPGPSDTIVPAIPSSVDAMDIDTGHISLRSPFHDSKSFVSFGAKGMEIGPCVSQIDLHSIKKLLVDLHGTAVNVIPAPQTPQYPCASKSKSTCNCKNHWTSGFITQPHGKGLIVHVRDYNRIARTALNVLCALPHMESFNMPLNVLITSNIQNGHCDCICMQTIYDGITKASGDIVLCYIDFVNKGAAAKSISEDSENVEYRAKMNVSFSTMDQACRRLKVDRDYALSSSAKQNTIIESACTLLREQEGQIAGLERALAIQSLTQTRVNPGAHLHESTPEKVSSAVESFRSGSDLNVTELKTLVIHQLDLLLNEDFDQLQKFFRSLPATAQMDAGSAVGENTETERIDGGTVMDTNGTGSAVGEKTETDGSVETERRDSETLMDANGTGSAVGENAETDGSVGTKRKERETIEARVSTDPSERAVHEVKRSKMDEGFMDL